MKKFTSLFALGIRLSSKILPIEAHAYNEFPTTGLLESPPSRLFADNNEVENEPVIDAELDESINIIEEQEVSTTQKFVTVTENESIYPDSITEAAFDEETGITYESSDDSMKEYDGSNPETYVWEKKLQSLDAKDTTIYGGDTSKVGVSPLSIFMTLVLKGQWIRVRLGNIRLCIHGS